MIVAFYTTWAKADSVANGIMQSKEAEHAWVEAIEQDGVKLYAVYSD
jgi:hypothetical protein